LIIEPEIGFLRVFFGLLAVASKQKAIDIFDKKQYNQFSGNSTGRSDGQHHNQGGVELPAQ